MHHRSLKCLHGDCQDGCAAPDSRALVSTPRRGFANPFRAMTHRRNWMQKKPSLGLAKVLPGAEKTSSGWPMWEDHIGPLLLKKSICLQKSTC